MVYGNVLDQDECAKTRNEIFSQLEETYPGFARKDRSTWSLLSSKTYGLPPSQVGGRYIKPKTRPLPTPPPHTVNNQYLYKAARIFDSVASVPL